MSGMQSRALDRRNRSADPGSECTEIVALGGAWWLVTGNRSHPGGFALTFLGDAGHPRA